MAERVVYSEGELATESGERIDAQALIGPQAAAIAEVDDPAAIAAVAAAGAAPDAAEFDALLADVTALHATVASLTTALNAATAALTNIGVLAAE